jgi:DNA-binding NtrC family response regulator
MNKKVAIIDDEQDILNVLTKYLSRSNKLDIETFSNPQSAHKSIMNGSYDLILLDIMMPQINGMDLLKEIKKNQVNAKVILMTAYTTLDRINEAYAIGADDYVTKPFISLKDVEMKIFDTLNL